MIAIVAVASAALWGQGPNPRPPAQEPSALVKTPLMPAEPVWTISLDAAPSAAGALDDDHVYLPLRSNRIVALARTDGHAVWSRDVESAVPPVTEAGLVFILASDELFALDRTTGSDRWRVPFEHGALSRLTVSDGRVFGFLAPGTLVALTSDTGTVAWKRDTGVSSAHAVLADGPRLYAALDDGTVVAVSAVNGDVLWQRTLPGTPAQPSLVAGRVIVGTTANEVFALESTTGAIAWRWRVGGDVVGAAGSSQSVFIAALDNVLRAVAYSSGNQRWKKPLASRPAHPPETFGTLVIVTSTAPTVSAYDALTGELSGTYTAPAELEGPALLAPGADARSVVMVVVTRDGRVVGLRPKAPEPASSEPEAPVPARGAGPGPLVTPQMPGVRPALPPQP